MAEEEPRGIGRRVPESPTVPDIVGAEVPRCPSVWSFIAVDLFLERPDADGRSIRRRECVHSAGAPRRSVRHSRLTAALLRRTPLTLGAMVDLESPGDGRVQGILPPPPRVENRSTSRLVRISLRPWADRWTTSPNQQGNADRGNMATSPRRRCGHKGGVRWITQPMGRAARRVPRDLRVRDRRWWLGRCRDRGPTFRGSVGQRGLDPGRRTPSADRVDAGCLFGRSRRIRKREWAYTADAGRLGLGLAEGRMMVPRERCSVARRGSTTWPTCEGTPGTSMRGKLMALRGGATTTHPLLQEE